MFKVQSQVDSSPDRELPWPSITLIYSTSHKSRDEAISTAK